MPAILLPLPHFKQSRDGMCLPACVRMILAYLGDEQPESRLAKLLRTEEFGAPVFNAKYVQKLGYSVFVGFLSKDKLERQLLQGHPVIARVWTAMLDYSIDVTSHVVVVVGFDSTHVYLNDPAFAAAPQKVLWDAFLAAWAEYDERSVIITQKG